jgi:hypothetical protein
MSLLMATASLFSLLCLVLLADCLVCVSLVSFKIPGMVGGDLIMTVEPVALKTLLRERHWKYATFCVEYDKVARTLDPGLTGTWPSRAQFQRWLAGGLRGWPYPDTCRVLEAMFPGWKVERLFARYPEHEVARVGKPEPAQSDRDLAGESAAAMEAALVSAEGYSDVVAVYDTRSEFTASMPAHALFDGARSIRACGLSLNLLCQQYAEHSLRRLAENGTQISCLFLDPDGKAIRERETEESYEPGTLSDLTRINIRSVQDRVRRLLPEEARSRLEIAIYDETIRFNIIVIDEQLAVVQPYLPVLRGVDSPTFVLRRRWENRGLFPVFDAVMSSLWTRARRI